MTQSMPKPGRNVLFISYAYPPSSSPGAIRISRLVSRLEAQGWPCHVMTVGQAVALRSGGTPDPLSSFSGRVLRVDDPLAKVANAAPAPVSSSKRKPGILRRIAEYLIFPDRTILWALQVRRHTGWAKSTGATIVHSTAPSLAAHLAAGKIARATGAKWVAEFRDPSSWFAREDKTPALKRWLLARLEAHIVKRADATVVVSEAFAEYFRGRYPGRSIHSIPNGAEFSEAALSAAMERRLARRARSAGSPLVLVHAGELYGGARNPAPLIQAALAAQKHLSRPIQLRFLGADSHIAGEAARRLGAEHLVDIVGPLPHSESLRVMQEADGLVALLHDDPIGRIGIMSKFFDYAASANPVLVVGERIAMLSRIVEENKMGNSCEYADVAGMSRWIERLAQSPQDYDYDCLDVCRRWSADAMAASMARLFNSLT